MRYVDDFLDSRGSHVLVMEDCLGGDLKQFIKDIKNVGAPEHIETCLALF